MIARVGLALCALTFVAACGGKVVFDGLPGAGGAGGASPTSTSTMTIAASSTVASSSAMSGGNFTCDIPVPTGDTSEYVCASDFAQPCPDVNDATLFNVLAGQIANQCEPAPTLDQIACGPDMSAASCCYQVFVSLDCEM